MKPYEFSPIGIIRTAFTSKQEAPRQPGMARSIENDSGFITLNSGHNFEQALADLTGFSHLWILYIFDQNHGWKPLVQTPRDPQKRGLFATRSPHRPNPIGLSLVELITIEGLTLHFRGADMLDGSPVIDIKPYLPGVESRPDARAGWVGEIELQAVHSMAWSERAQRQLAFLQKFGIDLLSHAERILSHDPMPHPYRRTKALGENRYELATKSWRVIYRIETESVTIESIASGYSPEAITAAPTGSLHDDEAHRAWLSGRLAEE